MHSLHVELETAYFIGEQVSVYSADQALSVVSLWVAVKALSGDASRACVGEDPSCSRRVTYVSINGVFPGGPIGGFHPQSIKSVMTAVEYLWSEQASFTLQFA